LQRRDEPRAYEGGFAGPGRASHRQEGAAAQPCHHAGDVAVPAEEARGVRLLERGEASEGTPPVAELERLLAWQYRLERAAELLRRREALGLALLQASIDGCAERPEIEAFVAHAGHGNVEVSDACQLEQRERREGVRPDDELVEHDAHGPEIRAEIDALG